MTHEQQQEPTRAGNTPLAILRWAGLLDLTSSRFWMFYCWAASSKHPRLFVSLSVWFPVVPGSVSVLFRTDCRYLTVVLFGFWMYRVIPVLFFFLLCILSHQINNKCNYSILSKKKGVILKGDLERSRRMCKDCVLMLCFFLFSLPEKCNLACFWTLAQFWGFKRTVSSLVPCVKKKKKKTRRDQTFHCEGGTGEESNKKGNKILIEKWTKVNFLLTEGMEAMFWTGAITLTERETVVDDFLSCLFTVLLCTVLV